MKKMTLIDINLEEIYNTSFLNKWRSKYPVFKNEHIKEWVSHKLERYMRGGKNPKGFKITLYLKDLDNYCKYYDNINPSDLLKEDINTRNSRLVRYLNHLIKIGKRETTIRNAVQSRIKSFYSDRGVPCSDGLTIFKSGENNNEIILDKNLIRKFQAKLERAEYRLALKFIAQTGLRVGDIFDTLKSGKYTLQKYKDHYFIRNFRTMKTGTIINYLFLPLELTDLMRSIYGDNLEELDLAEILKTKRVSDIRSADFWQRIKDIAKDLGIKENVKLHSFRKFFNSEIIRFKDFDGELKEHLLGHSSINLSQSYNNLLKDIEWVYSNWKKIENLISIDSRIQDRTAEDLKDVKSENIHLKQQIEILLESKINLEKKLKDLSNSTPSRDDIKKLVLDIMKSEQVKIDL